MFADSHKEASPLIDAIVANIAEPIDARLGSHLLAALVRCSDDAIFSVSPEGVIQSWNDAAERIYGYCAAEIVGKSVSTLSPTERANEAGEILEKWKCGEEVQNLELIRERKDGQRILIQLTISPVTNAAEQLASRGISQRSGVRKSLCASRKSNIACYLKLAILRCMSMTLKRFSFLQ
jgi:PAS domain S-box-containing protein